MSSSARFSRSPNLHCMEEENENQGGIVDDYYAYNEIIALFDHIWEGKLEESGDFCVKCTECDEKLDIRRYWEFLQTYDVGDKKVFLPVAATVNCADNTGAKNLYIISEGIEGRLNRHGYGHCQEDKTYATNNFIFIFLICEFTETLVTVTTEHRTLELSLGSAKDLKKVNFFSRIDVYVVVSLSGVQKIKTVRRLEELDLGHLGVPLIWDARVSLVCGNQNGSCEVGNGLGFVVERIGFHGFDSEIDGLKTFSEHSLMFQGMRELLGEEGFFSIGFLGSFSGVEVVVRNTLPEDVIRYRCGRFKSTNFWKGHSGSMFVLPISLYISYFELATPIFVHLQLLEHLVGGGVEAGEIAKVVVIVFIVVEVVGIWEVDTVRIKTEAGKSSGVAVCQINKKLTPGGYFPGGFNPPELNQPHSSQGSSAEISFAAALSLGTDNRGPPLLLGLHHYELRSLSLLLRHLLLFHRLRELAVVGEVRDGDIIENNVEILGAANETVVNQSGYLRTVGEKLIRIELRDDGLENLVAYGRKNLLIVLKAEVLYNNRELAEGQDRTQSVFGAGDGGEGVRARADVEDVRLLDPRDEEMGSLAYGVVENASETGGGEGGGRHAQPEGVAGKIRQERDGSLAASHFGEGDSANANLLNVIGVVAATIIVEVFVSIEYAKLGDGVFNRSCSYCCLVIGSEIG
ncbi:hypothetical protein V8G54_034243 [Vigna mungo]|uniref:Uncharacterized protein n=1 Tax=Vigna mungo TaxID=3915 RepID=A0AAQ3RKK2_VIGMU